MELFRRKAHPSRQRCPVQSGLAFGFTDAWPPPPRRRRRRLGARWRRYVSAERACRHGGGALRPRLHRAPRRVRPRRRLLQSFIRFFHAADWKKEPWLIGMISFYASLPLVTIISRKNINLQLILSALTFFGVSLAERLNAFLGQNWKSFSSQNYFDPQGLFISVMWSAPLLLITILILVNTLVTLCMLMVRWKRAELKHHAREARSKQE